MKKVMVLIGGISAGSLNRRFFDAVARLAADGAVVIDINGDDSQFKKVLSGLKSAAGTATRFTTAIHYRYGRQIFYRCAKRKSYTGVLLYGF